MILRNFLVYLLGTYLLWNIFLNLLLNWKKLDYCPIIELYGFLIFSVYKSFVRYMYCEYFLFLIKIFLKILFISQGEGKGEWRKGRETHQSVASSKPSFGDLACNPGMCPDWEPNQWPFGLQASS